MNIKKDKTKISISKNSNLNGIIWSEAYVELLGSVNGSIATNLFYFYDPPTKYLNWLINAELIYDRNIHKQVLPLVFADNYKFEIKEMTAF